MKYSISTNTRYLIKASSEKKAESEIVLFLYRPSIGDTAFNSFNVVIVVLLFRVNKDNRFQIIDFQILIKIVIAIAIFIVIEIDFCHCHFFSSF